MQPTILYARVPATHLSRQTCLTKESGTLQRCNPSEAPFRPHRFPCSAGPMPTRSHATLLIGTLVELASGLSMQPYVHDVPSFSRLARPASSPLMVDKDARLRSVGTQAMAAMAAAMISTSGVNLVQPFASPAFAAYDANARTFRKDARVTLKKSEAEENAFFRTAFAQSEKLVFSELNWGDAEAETLSQALYSAKDLKKLFLNGNGLTDEGAEAIATALRNGAAPKLKILNLSQKGPLSEKTKRCLKESRDGLQVSFAQPKQATDGPVYFAADQGILKPERVIERAQNTISGTGQPLVDGSAATCAELKKIIKVDKETLVLEKKKLAVSGALSPTGSATDPAQVKTIETIGGVIEKQIAKLELIKTKKGCS